MPATLPWPKIPKQPPKKRCSTPSRSTYCAARNRTSACAAVSRTLVTSPRTRRRAPRARAGARRAHGRRPSDGRAPAGRARASETSRGSGRGSGSRSGRRRGLVEDENAGAEEHGARDRERLALAPRQRPYRLVRIADVDAHLEQVAADVPLRPASVEEAHERRALGRLRAEEEVAPDRHQRDQRQVLIDG